VDRACPLVHIEYLSPSLCEYTGIKEAHHCDSFPSRNPTPDDLQTKRPILGARFWPETTWERLELRLRRTDGEYRWFLCRVKTIRNESGRLLRWIGVSWDIHDRKTAESLLRIERGKPIGRIVDSVPACVCVGGPTGELVYVNKNRPSPRWDDRWRKIVGDRWMAYIHPDDLPAALQRWKACIAARETGRHCREGCCSTTAYTAGSVFPRRAITLVERGRHQLVPRRNRNRGDHQGSTGIGGQ